MSALCTGGDEDVMFVNGVGRVLFGALLVVFDDTSERKPRAPPPHERRTKEKERSPDL